MTDLVRIYLTCAFIVDDLVRVYLTCAFIVDDLVRIYLTCTFIVDDLVRIYLTCAFIVDNFRVSHCSGSTLWKVMDLSDAIFHGLLNIIYNQVLAFQKNCSTLYNQEQAFTKSLVWQADQDLRCTHVQCTLYKGFYSTVQATSRNSYQTVRTHRLVCVFT